MTHNEQRAHWVKEGFIGLGIGVLFGATNVAVGHGSGVYRSIQFSAFEAAYTLSDNNFGTYEIPLTHGLQIRVILGGIASGTMRAIVETPLEYAKTRRQTLQNWKIRDAWTGFNITLLRANILMPSYFIFFDSFRRNFPDFFNITFFGPFLTSGVSSVFAWWVCWPFEYMKCQIQGGYLDEKHMTLLQRFRYAMTQRGGFFGLYRGILPGSIRSFAGNGCAMVLMQYAQKKVSEWGWRD